MKTLVSIAVSVVALTAFAAGGGDVLKRTVEQLVFEDDFTQAEKFYENWSVGGSHPGEIVCRDGAVRLPNDGDRIYWRGELPDEYAVEATLVNAPAWSVPCATSGGARWAGIQSDYGNFSVGADCRTSLLYVLPPPATQITNGAYTPIKGYKHGDAVTIRLERRRSGAGQVRYSYFVNGAPMGAYDAPMPKKIRAYDGSEHNLPLTFAGLRLPFEIRHVKIFTPQAEIYGRIMGNVEMGVDHRRDVDGGNVGCGSGSCTGCASAARVRQDAAF